MSKKILVAYFSASGVTAKAAWKLSEAAGAAWTYQWFCRGNGCRAKGREGV